MHSDSLGKLFSNLAFSDPQCVAVSPILFCCRNEIIMTFLWNGSDRRRRCNQRDEAVVICHCWKSKNGARATVVLCTGMGLRYGPRLRESWWIFLCYTVQRLQFVHFILWQIWGASFSPSLNSLSCSLCTAIVEGRILRALIMYLCDVSFMRRNIKPRISLRPGRGNFCDTK